MNRIALINKALDLIEFGSIVSCPAGLIRCLESLHIPAKVGKPVVISPAEAARFWHRVHLEFEVSAEAMRDPSFRIPEGASRITLARLLGNEKAGGARTGRGERILTGQVTARAMLNGKDYGIPRGTCKDFTPEEIEALGPAGIILVENEEAFMAFDNLRFEIPSAYRDFLVLYRGGPDRSQKVCEQAIKSCACTVVVFPDFDPAGLVQALAVPGMAAILWPGPEMLTAAIDRCASVEKWLKQVGGARKALAECHHPDVREIWSVLKRHGKVPAQEAFFTAPA